MTPLGVTNRAPRRPLDPALDRFNTMESFVRVARSGSFTVAANQLGLSRALVSRHISSLEHRLGVRLLNRSTRSLNLTDEGRSYLEFCEQILRQIETSERAIGRIRAEPVGTLKVAVPKSFGLTHVVDAAVAFTKVQPRLRLSLILEDVSFRRPYDFVERGLDLVLRISSPRISSLAEQTITAIDWCACAAPDYLAREGRPGAPAELGNHSCLVHVNVAPQDRIWRFEGPKGHVSVKVTGTFFSNSALALRKAALAGLGIAVVPRYCVADDLASGMLVPVLPRYQLAARPLIAVYPRAAVVPQKVQVFVDFMKEWTATRDINHGGSHVPLRAARV
jgi:DNA-binding transcriptional LysR family regulator